MKLVFLVLSLIFFIAGFVFNILYKQEQKSGIFEDRKTIRLIYSSASLICFFLCMGCAYLMAKF